MWDICQVDIDNFILWWDCMNGQSTVGCENVIAPTAEILEKIYTWPAHGDLNQGESYFLAPFLIGIKTVSTIQLMEIIL